jgi:ribonuclease D
VSNKVSQEDIFVGDLSNERMQHYLKKPVIAVDTETRGLNLRRDRLCLIQICDEAGVVSFVRYVDDNAPNLKKLLAADVLKLCHYARFDMAVLKYYLKVDVWPVFCSKIASKLVRTYTDRHSLKDLVREFLGTEMDKTNQTSDWGRADLSPAQLDYAADDVRVLIPIYNQMVKLLEREKLTNLAQQAFNCLPAVTELDICGYRDIFEH